MRGEDRWIVLIGLDEDGRRSARRLALSIPLALARRGFTEDGLGRISDRALRDLKNDLLHELARREGRLHELGGWDPNVPSKEHPRLSERELEPGA